MKLSEAKSLYPEAETFTLGDNEGLCNELLALVRSGKKTATCSVLSDIEQGREEMPAVGRRDIALNWDGTPALVIETLSLVNMRFRDVDEAFALAEGEDESLEGWRESHQQYFERTTDFDPGMMLVCERFRVVRDFS